MLVLCAWILSASPIMRFEDSLDMNYFGKFVKELEERFVNLEEMATAGTLRSAADGNDIGDILRGLQRNEDRVAKLEDHRLVWLG